MSRYDDFDDDRSVMYIGPRAFVAAFGALCLTLLGVTYGAARITESMDDGAASPVIALPAWTASPLTTNPAPASALRSPFPMRGAAASPVAAASARTVPAASAPRSVARPADVRHVALRLARPAMPVHRLAAPHQPVPVPKMLVKAHVSVEPMPVRKPAPVPVPQTSAVAPRRHSAGLLVTLGSSAMAPHAGALAPHAPDASMMLPDASGGSQPHSAVAAPAPIR